MICKIGKIQQTTELAENVSEVREATIVEKTQGDYIEVLYCLDKIVLNDHGAETIASSDNTFDVYIDKSVTDVLTINGHTDYTWFTPLTEV